MGVLTRFLTVAFFRSRIHTKFYLHFPVDDSSHWFTACLLCYVHGEAVGSIRTHHALPVYRPFHCFALGNGLFSTLLLYQRIVNLMAALEGIGCSPAYIH